MPPKKKDGGQLRARLAKTTGTTPKEAAGVVKQVRGLLAADKTGQARRMLRDALEGGPKGGISKTKQSTQKARRRSGRAVERLSKKVK